MSVIPYDLGPTTTYRKRTALWVGGVGTGDGALVLTVYGMGKLPEQKCYWVEVIEGRVLVWKATGGVRQRPYTVTAEKCSCEGMWKHDSPPCKHLVSIQKLLAGGHLRQGE